MTASTQPVGSPPGPTFIVMLGLMAVISPLSMSVHVQSIPTIAVDLDTSYSAVQLTISVFLFTFAFAQFFAGPLSDRLGRRPVLFGGLILFATASVVAALAPTIEIMVAARFAQAVGGCASLVTPRAVIQDRYSGIDAARMMAFVAILQSCGPIMGPVIGGSIDAIVGWRGIFGFLAVYAVMIAATTALRLPESRPMDGGRIASWATIFSRYRTLLTSRRYVAYTGVFALGTTGFFGYLATGPAVIIGELGHEPWQFSLMLTVMSLQFVIAGYAGSRLVIRLGIDRILVLGATLQLVAVAAIWIVAQAPTAITVTVAMCVYTFSNGLIFSNSLAGATAIDPRIAGSAASFLGAMQFTVGGIIALTLGELPTASFGYLPLALALVGLGTLVSAIVALTSRPA